MMIKEKHRLAKTCLVSVVHCLTYFGKFDLKINKLKTYSALHFWSLRMQVESLQKAKRGVMHRDLTPSIYMIFCCITQRHQFKVHILWRRVTKDKHVPFCDVSHDVTSVLHEHILQGVQMILANLSIPILKGVQINYNQQFISYMNRTKI